MCLWLAGWRDLAKQNSELLCNFVLICTNSFWRKRYETCRTMRSWFVIMVNWHIQMVLSCCAFPPSGFSSSSPADPRNAYAPAFLTFRFPNMFNTSFVQFKIARKIMIPQHIHDSDRLASISSKVYKGIFFGKWKWKCYVHFTIRNKRLLQWFFIY